MQKRGMETKEDRQMGELGGGDDVAIQVWVWGERQKWKQSGFVVLYSQYE